MNKTCPPLILIVDDEPGIVRTLQSNLEANGFKTLAATNGVRALEIIEEQQPDLLILDIMMPNMNGFEVCHRVRKFSQIPIIMLSARRSEEDKVKSLNLGSDDYISKPFGMSELVARLRAVLRRTTYFDTMPAKPAITIGDLTINFRKRQVTLASKDVLLTPTEYSLLRELVLNEGVVLTHSQLLNKVWGPEYREEREYLRVFIGHLRAKLEPDPTKPRYIVTAPGVGYKFHTED